MKVVADDKIPFLKGVLEPFADVVYMKGSDIKNEHLMDADALITRTRTKCNEALLKGTPVKFIATATIGFDHIDTSYCDSHGIFWTNAPGCNSGSVYQYMASVFCMLAQKHQMKFEDISLGVVGVGNVGRKVVRLAEILGMKVYLNDPPRQRASKGCGFVSLSGILRECNMVTFHVPLQMDGIDKTYHLVDADFIRRLNPGTVLINSSRGEVIDNQVLKQALKENTVKASVLDVWETEPEIDTELLGLVDAGTPHIAGYSLDGKANGTAMSVQALSRFFKLPLDTWQPEDIPLPAQPEFQIDCSGKTEQEIFIEAIEHTYKVERDFKTLTSSVATFEKQRGDYPVRREFHAYSIELLNPQGKIAKKLSDLGFKIL